jgi:hypothetical protein
MRIGFSPILFWLLVVVVSIGIFAVRSYLRLSTTQKSAFRKTGWSWFKAMFSVLIPVGLLVAFLYFFF